MAPVLWGDDVPDRRKRSRHTVPTVLLPVLRILGWRYSPTRDAWVHRIGGGRRGPVFRDHVSGAATTPPVDVHHIDRHLLSEVHEVATERAEPGELPRRADRTIDLTDPAAPQLTAIDGDGDEVAPEGPRVDGRPPRRDLPGTFRSAKPTLRVG